MFFRRSIVPLLFLSCFPFVSGYTYGATPQETGNLVIFSIFALLFIVEIGLCVVALAIARGFRTPFALLLPAIILYFLSCLSAIANDVAVANVEDSPPSGLIVATNAMLEFFPDWGNVLLFGSICLAFFNRQAALNRHSGGRSPSVNIFQKIGLAFYSVLLFILATASGALITVYLNALFSDNRRFTIRVLNHKFNTYKNMFYAFNSFLIISAFFVVFCAVVLFQAMRRAAVSDTASKAIVFAATPLYIVYMIITMVFVILNSPAGLKRTASLATTQDANAALNNLFFFANALLLIIVGFKRSNYAVGNTSNMVPAQVPMQGYPQSGYYPYPQQQQALGFYYAQYPDPQKPVGENTMAGAPPTLFKQ